MHPRNIPEKPVFRFFRISGFQLASSLTVPLPIVRVNFARAKVTSSLLQQGPVLTIHRFKKMVEIYYLRARINPGDRSIRGHGREILYSNDYGKFKVSNKSTRVLASYSPCPYLASQWEVNTGPCTEMTCSHQDKKMLRASEKHSATA